MKHFYKFSLMMALSAFFFSCSQEEIAELQTEQQEKTLHIVGEMEAEIIHGEADVTTGMASTFTETFDGAYKEVYTGAPVQFKATQAWYLSDAVTGTSEDDRKEGGQSIRIRNNGFAEMGFDMENGIHTVQLRHGKFGQDGYSAWRLLVSEDQGESWKIAGVAVSVNSRELATVTFRLNTPGSTRLAIEKVGGGNNRINIDKLVIVPNTPEGPDAGTLRASRDNNTEFGYPSNPNYVSSQQLISRYEYTLAYDRYEGKADWVSWHLSSAWRGGASRQDNFRADPYVPNSWYSPTYSDYTNSGFDRGHLCPSADRTYSTTANSNTFYMTNIAPQSPRNNQRTWKYLEDYCRKLTDQGNELYIIAGSNSQGGAGRNGYKSTIDGGNITVPKYFWKAILVLPEGTSDRYRVNNNTRIIAVSIPNFENISTNWGSYRVSVDDIEYWTGLNLFSGISNTYEGTLEARVDNGPTY